MEKSTVHQLAQLVDARIRCMQSGNVEWFDRHTDEIKALVKARLPSGSGFDAGTTLDLDESRADKLVFQTSFHHTNEQGSYDGWTEHAVTVTPSFIGGFDLKISGKDRNQIKDYIGETFVHALREAA